jgi:hypothetical protein
MITKDDNIGMLLRKYEGIGSVFRQMGMNCENCASADGETVKKDAKSTGRTSASC